MQFSPLRKYKNTSSSLNGFTVVELLIVIVVLGILVALIIVSFNGIQRRATESTIKSDLQQAARVMGVEHATEEKYPTALPSTVRSSPGVILNLSAPGGGNVYTALSPVENGLLFFDTCNQMIAEGVGQRSDGYHYVSECRVYNRSQIHVNGWNGRDINTGVTTASLDTYVASYSGGEKPLFTTEGGNFMAQWINRFQAAGGTFPVTSFWDSWATPTNGGVMKPTMPPPTSTGGAADPNSYCIDATHQSFADMQWHVRQGQAPTQGTCATT